MPSTKTKPTKLQSPLRYPGGKTRAISILESYVSTHYPQSKVLVSPFFGGGSFELHMKSRGYRVKGNDLFSPLFTFWTVLQTRVADLVAAVRAKMPVTKESFLALRASVCTAAPGSIDTASSYFVINRCSFSGATLCGGFSAQAAEGRLTESSIQRLTATAAGLRTGITFSNLDCKPFLEANPQTAETVVYADPPYYIETYIYGKDGDMHENFDHAGFAAAIKKRSDWIISYNDCPYIRKLYQGCRIFEESWSYGMNASKKSSEIIILPPLPVPVHMPVPVLQAAE